MAKNITSRKEQGVVLILILAFMTMFAIMIAAFLIVTANMSDSAANSLASFEKAESIADRSGDDIDAGIKTLLAGTNNAVSPIGPFGILENLYGENTASDGSDNLEFRIRRLYGIYDNDPDTDRYPTLPGKAAIEFQYDNNLSTMETILCGGDVLTFGPVANADQNPDCALYNTVLRGSSARIVQKEFFTVSDATATYFYCRCHLQITPELTDLFVKLIDRYRDNNPGILPYFTVNSTNIFQLNENAPYWPTATDYSGISYNIALRLNLPAFSGTGAGDFLASDFVDGQTSPAPTEEGEVSTNTFRLPYAFWANAAAPDMTPFAYVNAVGNTVFDFRTLRQHLANRDYRPFGRNASQTITPYYSGESRTWSAEVDNTGIIRNPVRMNPGYTAPDVRTLFLSQYRPNPNNVERTKTTPSFVRPDTLTAFLGQLEMVLNYNDGQSDDKNKKNPNVDWLSVLRKMIPRPLPADHWKWTGGNGALALDAETKTDLHSVTDAASYYSAVNGHYGGHYGWVTKFLYTLTDQNHLNPWDVDNDNDGVKDGIWIPSGLPIRVDENGTPYATMFSFTVLDMDGRVNVNTAGNRDQLVTQLGGADVFTSLETLAGASPSASPLSPWFRFEKLEGGLGWMSDVDDVLYDVTGLRGTGRGPASLNLRAALSEMKIPDALPLKQNDTQTPMDPGLTAANLLYKRYLSADFDNLSDTGMDLSGLPILLDGKDTAVNSEHRWNLPQPSAYVDPTATYNNAKNWTPDNVDSHRRFFLNTDAVYKGEKSDTVADPNLFVFPWRGKTRVFDYGVTNSSPRYPLSYADYPTFDFGDSALRSFDPLGNDILTYMPRFGENPYLVNPYGATAKDATFQVGLLETLLRPFDYDRKSFGSDLLETLLGNVPGLFVNETERKNYLDAYQDRVDRDSDPFRALRQDVTTISSDIPAPSQVFPTGPEEEKDGVFGIRALIRHCVILEFYQKNRESRYDDAFITNAKKQYAVEKFGSEDVVLPEDDESKKEIRRYVRGKVEDDLHNQFNDKIDALTEQLYRLLPDDIQAGRKLDLNALTRKAGWIDAVYDQNDNDNDESTLVRTYNPQQTAGDAAHLSQEEFDAAHARGLVERMKFARGLYVLLMTLTYEDRNANEVSLFYDSDGSLAAENDDYKTKYQDYLEGADDDFLQTLDEEDRNERSAELIANRLAQWVVNLIDFSDPDATMTPFFYDPNPFDGWWAYNPAGKDWMLDTGDDASNADFVPVFMTPSVNTDYPENDAFDYFDRYFNTPDAEFDNTPDANDENVLIFNSDEYHQSGDTWAQVFVSCLMGQTVTTDGVAKEDFGFRLIWGMERPDLLLTETLSFHDLGIADTKNETVGGRGDKVDGDDEDFDQVRRPLGSTYLELYCAANPNVPQSPELYEFDTDRNLWKLDLSKMTPRQKSDSPYYDSENSVGREFPIWRVAISASCDPRQLNKDNTTETLNDPTDNTITYKRSIRKRQNSVIEKLLGDNKDNARIFSLRTRQFCDLVTDGDTNSLDDRLNSKWRGYDYCVSNILGPTFVATEDADPDFSQEIEIDRIVWFGWPTLSGSTRDAISQFPDSSHIFSRVKEKTDDSLETFLFPNQYLVVGPATKRAIGSRVQLLTDGRYFGVPSENKLDISALDASTNNAYIMAGTYKGIDVNSDAKFEINKRGLNISEPLWLESTDPYSTNIPTKDIEIDGETITVTDVSTEAVPNIPFDRPEAGGGHDKDDFPIAVDRLFGLGTVPGYRSAFVQRVADPNRPYHPSANPYLTVDWNMMDLTVFNGEAVDPTDHATGSKFWKGSETDDVDDKNNLLFKKSVMISADGKGIKFDPDSSSSIFSSRGWLNPNQKGFFPSELQTNHRPNPWARAVDADALSRDDKGGLESGENPSETEDSVVKVFPKHSLGVYNSGKIMTNMSERFADVAVAADRENLRKLYYGAPANDSGEFQPFEHLIWNDAPFDSSTELLLAPASVSGRFGLEFIRNKDIQDGDFSLSSLFHAGAEKKKRRLGRSLGSGYEDGTEKRNLFGWTWGKTLVGPCLNFHQTSGTLGESLNLSKIFDFVTIPSLYVGTKTFLGYDADADPVYAPTMREPGKVNVNTLRSAAWAGLVGANDSAKAPTLYDDFRAARIRNNQTMTRQEEFVPFQPAHTAPIKAVFPHQDVVSDETISSKSAPGDLSLLSRNLFADSAGNNLPNENNNPIEPVLDNPTLGNRVKKNNLYTATEELRKLSGMTTNRSNVFAVWMTVGYFKVEKAQPGVNMPAYDPEGNLLPTTDPTADLGGKAYLNLVPGDKYYDYYRVIYPDGYTYGKEMGTEGVDEGGVTRPRAFYLIDRSIPVDFRRGRSWNWDKTILLERKL